MRGRIVVVASLLATALGASPMPYAAAACTLTRVPGPNKGTTSNIVRVVDAAGPRTAWAAGHVDDVSGSGNSPQTWRFNGSDWKLVRAPAPGGDDLWAVNVGGIAAIGRKEAWLSGNWFENAGAWHSLLMHFENGRWRIVRTPPGTRNNAGLAGIDARNANDVWAVGNAGSDGFVIHYDGRRWRKMEVPDVGTSGNGLDAVSVVPGTKNQVWVAGTYSGPPMEAAYLARWNGKRWKVFHAPQPGPQVHLYDIDAAARNDVWAAGYLTGQPNTWGGATFHFDGSAWSYEAPPDPSLGFPGTFLYAVAALGPGGAIATGDSHSAGTPPLTESQIMVVSWDGAAWNTEPIAGVASPSLGQDVARIPGTNDVWVGGFEWVGGRFEVVFLRGC